MFTSFATSMTLLFVFSFFRSGMSAISRFVYSCTVLLNQLFCFFLPVVYEVLKRNENNKTYVYEVQTLQAVTSQYNRKYATRTIESLKTNFNQL